ncbi:MAG: hypothetical protein AAF430_25015 [Myxococcota bacterium]
MTIMRVSLVGASLDAERKQQLASRLIAAFARVEVGQDSPAAHAGFLVHFEEVAPEDLYMGAQRMADAGGSGRAAVVTTQVMAGPWTDAMKAQLFGDLESVIREEVDMPRSGSGADFWMTITEVPEGAWGYGGKPVSIASLAPVFSEDRQARIHRYLEDRSE